MAIQSQGRSILLGAASVALVLTACRSTFLKAPEPVLPVASEVFYGAWAAERRTGELSEETLSTVHEAVALDPQWIAPQRFLDEYVHRPALTLPERYGEHVTTASDQAQTRTVRARSSYLAGRLGGEAGDRRLTIAADLDPSLGWAWHGIGWRAFGRGDGRRAIAAGRRAVAYARDAHELTHFSSALARYLGLEELNTAAQKLLTSTVMTPGSMGLRTDERARLLAELCGFELNSIRGADVRRGVRRALGALAGPGLTLRERLSLVLALRSGPVSEAAVAEEEIAFAVLEGAEAGVPGEAVRRLMDATLGDSTGSLGAASRGSSLTASRPENAADRLVAAFREPLGSGAALDAMEAWFAELPLDVKSPTGEFTRAPLNGLLGVLRSETKVAQPNSRVSLDSLARVGAALMDAGWYREARALAEGVLGRLGPVETLAPRGAGVPRPIAAEARQLQRDAIEARAILGGIGALARRIDAREAFVNAGALGSDGIESVEGGNVESLRELRREIADLFLRYGKSVSLPEVDASPVIKYGPLGRIVHPGPAFSAEDEAQGRGPVGEPVPGIAALFSRMGRFALLGLGVGQGGPDATVLRLVGVQQRAGEHLGRPFRGTVFWCDGADVPGRFGRRGASISGAALHEGYYVDLSMVRMEEGQWDRLRDRFQGDAQGVRTALDAPAAKVPERFRVEVSPALGAGDRMRLSVMNGAVDGALRKMTLAELAHVVATHEEGHLCDRASWYPVTFMRVMRLISFAGAHGFRSARIGQALEERAQLVALCECDDSRLAWIDLLDAAESGDSGGVTPHAVAYRRLLGDLFDRLDAEWEAGGWRDTALDPAARWIDQLHRLDGEDLRGLAVREAKSRGVAAR